MTRLTSFVKPEPAEPKSSEWLRGKGNPEDMKDYTQLLETYFHDLVTTHRTGGGVKEESY